MGNQAKRVKLYKFNNFRAYLIGRNIDKSQIVLNDSTISRVHAELSFVNNKIYLKDLGSGKEIC